MEPPDGEADADAACAAVHCNEWDGDKAKPYEIPTLEEVKRYCRQKGLRHTDPAEYYDYYAANGWMVGVSKGNPSRMVDWKAHIRRWDSGNRKREQSASGAGGGRSAADNLRALRQKFKEEDGT